MKQEMCLRNNKFTPQERLDFLLKQIEVFTKFIVRSNTLNDRRDELLKEANGTPGRLKKENLKQRHRGTHIKEDLEEEND